MRKKVGCTFMFEGQIPSLSRKGGGGERYLFGKIPAGHVRRTSFLAGRAGEKKCGALALAFAAEGSLLVNWSCGG